MTETDGLTGRIAYLSGEYPRATDTFIQREVAALRKLGVDVLTCSIRRTDASHHVGPEQRAEFARTFQIQQESKRPFTLIGAHLSLLWCCPRAWLQALALAWRTCPPGVKALVWQIFYFLEAGVLARHLQRQEIVHLHNHFANSSCSVAMLASQMSGIPYSFTLHGPAIFFEPMHWRIDVKIARARFVACISHFCRAQAMLFSDQVHWYKLKIVHCGVDPALYHRPAERQHGKQVLFIGRLAAIKGVALLIDSIATLRPDHPDLHLTLVGDGPERAALTAKVQALGLTDAVTFTGYLSQTDVASRLADADIFVLPSFAEGVPVVLMEAMAAGLPVIASQVAGVSELVSDGEAGFLVPAGDNKLLTLRIASLLNKPEEGKAMGKAGQSKILVEYETYEQAKILLNYISFGKAEIGVDIKTQES